VNVALPRPQTSAAPDAAFQVALLIASTAVTRLGLAAAVGLSVDESYIVGISREWALSYFDHPPLHIWLVRAWATLAGSESAVVVRLPFIALFAGSTWVMYRLTARLCGERAGFWAAVTLNLAPVFTLSIGSWVLPDGPLVFFSLLAASAVANTVLPSHTPARRLVGWLASGAAGGLAVLSKYTGLFVPVGVALFLVTARPYRRYWSTPGPWLAALIGVAIFSPALIWNAQHHWVSLAFQSGRVASHGFRLVWPLQDVVGQLAYLTPWVAVPLIIVLVLAVRRGPSDAVGWFFACLASGPIALFTLVGLWSPILAHWPIIGWLFAFPLLGAALARLEASRPSGVRWYCRASTGLLVILLGVALSQATTGWITRMVPAWVAVDPTLDVLDWRELEPALAHRGLLKPGTVLATPSWIDSGKVNYVLGTRYPVLCLCSDPRGFAFLTNRRAYAGVDVILISNATRTDWMRTLGGQVGRLESLPDIVLTRGSQPAVTLHVARGVGLRAPDSRLACEPQNYILHYIN
jgi:Dolichyl-phosphate-mannose-protein mannosyltransferase